MKTVKPKKQSDKSKMNKTKNKINEPTLSPSVPTLLLNYTYSLNTKFSKTLSTGFDSNSFEAVIVLNDACSGFVKLSALDWYSIFVKLDKINEIIQRFLNMENADKIKSNIILSRNLAVQVLKDESGVIKIGILKNENGVKQIYTLNYMEYISFHGLSEFIHLVITFNRTASPHVCAYFNTYIQKCIEFNTAILDSQHYFTPTNLTGLDSINYSRLFYELSFMCGEKIVKSIESLKNVYI